MNYVRDGDVFVVTKLDRLARSVLELMQITQALQDKQCDLQVLDQELDTSTPTGRLIFHVLAVIGEFERELLDMLESVVVSKEKLARQFNVSRATVYRLAAKLDKEFEDQTQAI